MDTTATTTVEDTVEGKEQALLVEDSGDGGVPISSSCTKTKKRTRQQQEPQHEIVVEVAAVDVDNNNNKKIITNKKENNMIPLDSTTRTMTLTKVRRISVDAPCTVTSTRQTPELAANNKDMTVTKAVAAADVQQSFINSNNINNNNNNNKDMETLLHWQRGRMHTDSLRIAVSNIAALTGYHPYKVLPEVLFHLVYQGRDGQALLQHDAQLLGIELITSSLDDDDDDEDIELQVLRELAERAGQDTQHALQKAIAPTAAASMSSIQKAEQCKRAVVQAAQNSGKLQPRELKQLQEGVRSRVDTQFGRHYEADALDWLQQQSSNNAADKPSSSTTTATTTSSSCVIRNRNSEILEWPFQKQTTTETASISEIITSTNTRTTTNTIVETVIPMGPPRPRRHYHQRQGQQVQQQNKHNGGVKRALEDMVQTPKQEPVEETEDMDDKGCCSKLAKEGTTRSDSNQGVGNAEMMVVDLTLDEGEEETNKRNVKVDLTLKKDKNMDDNCFDKTNHATQSNHDLMANSTSDCTTTTVGTKNTPTTIENWLDTTMEHEHHQKQQHQHNSDKEKKKLRPFFYIVGSVDGIRDEWMLLPKVPADPGNQDTKKKKDDDDEFGNLDDDIWHVESSIVEVKHRMRRFHKIAPPLYEQIQAVVYCLMYNVPQADLVEVLRLNKKKEKKTKDAPITNQRQQNQRLPNNQELEKLIEIDTQTQEHQVADERGQGETSPTTSKNDNTNKRNVLTKRKRITRRENGKPIESPVSSSCSPPRDKKSPTRLQDWLGIKPKQENHNEGRDIAKTRRTKQQQERQEQQSSQRNEGRTTSHTNKQENSQPPSNSRDDYEIQCCVHRIAVDDPIMAHRQQFVSCILPRLQSMVELVYRIRQEDGLRYQWLLTVCEGMTMNRYDEAWNLLFAECPQWLHDCEPVLDARRRTSEGALS